MSHALCPCMDFPRIKTSKEYHDSRITQVAWHQPSDLELTIELDAHWNKGGAETATLRFMGVKNKPQVEAALQAIADNRTHQRWIAEIVAFRRHGKARYILDTTPQPPLIIECASYVEI
jgi:hypothetical protein